MRFNDAITGGVLVVFAVAEIAYTTTFPSLHGQKYGPDLFPRLIGFGLFGFGCILILRGLLARRAHARTLAGNVGARDVSASVSKDTTDTADAVVDESKFSWIDSSNIAASRHARNNALLALFFLLVYIFLSDWIGFIPLSLAIVSVLIYRLGSPVYVAALLAVLTTAVIQFLFAKVLLVPLPAGWLQGIVW